jgi:hypothetical protein
MSKKTNIDPAPTPPEPDRQTAGLNVAPVPDPAGVTRGAERVAKKAKNIQEAAKLLFEEALATEQMALFNEPEFEEAMVLDGPELRKKYTGKQAEKIEWRRNMCLFLLSREVPVQDIGKLMHMNVRTIRTLAASHGRATAAFTEEYAMRLLGSAGSDIALADTKRDEASYKDLHIGAGIKLTHATALRLVAEAGEKPALDVEATEDGLGGLREILNQLEAAQNGLAPEPNTTTPTTEPEKKT